MAETLIVPVEDFTSSKFDFVLVGGGTAGLTIASRLTEDPHVNVGVLEAGPSRLGDPLVDTPAAFIQMLGNPDYDYTYITEPQAANRSQKHHIVRGKMLGGSSGINYMMYVRGSLQDYDDWAELAGDEGWSAKNLQKYVRKHQTLEPLAEDVTDRTNFPFVGEHHGTDGPVRTSFNQEPMLPVEAAVIKSLDTVTGLPKPKDPWSGDHLGFFSTLGSVVRSGPDKGKRSYAARGYLGLAKDRPNLKILCDATVNKVNLEGDRATGVNFTYKERTYDIQVAKEVILTGGVIASPQILELSGIGDPEVLKAAGVEPKIVNKDIGNHFQDHVLSSVAYKLKAGVMSGDVLGIPEVMQGAQKQYIEQQSGPLTSISSSQGFLPYRSTVDETELQKTIDSIQTTIDSTDSDFYKRQLRQIIAHLKDNKSANLQWVGLPVSLNPTYAAIENQAKLYVPDEPPSMDKPFGIAGVVCLQYPVSRGSIHIRSADVNDHPRIDPGYLKHPADVAAIAGGLGVLDKAMKHEHLESFISHRYHPADKYDLSNLESAKEAVRDWCMSEYHVCGSVPMGAALDSRLRVNGVRNLRVADASVFPNNVSGNICSSVYTVAERAAAILKEDHGFQLNGH